MQAWVSCSGGWSTACDPHALGGAQCGEQRGPNREHISTDSTRPRFVHSTEKTYQAPTTFCWQMKAHRRMNNTGSNKASRHPRIDPNKTKNTSKQQHMDASTPPTKTVNKQ